MFLRQGISPGDFRRAEQGSQVRLFSRLLAYCFALVIVLIAILWPVLVNSPLQLSLSLTTLLVTAAAWVAARSNRLWITRGLISVGYWVLVTILVGGTGGLTSPWLLTQLVVVGMTGLVVGGTAALVLSVLSILADAALFWLQPMLSQPVAPAPPIEYLASILINFLMIGGVIYLTNELVKRTAVQARDNELRYRSLFDKTNDAVFLVGLDNRCIKTNDQAARLLGYEAHELAGLHIDQIVDPEERDQAHSVAGRLQDEGLLPVYERTMVRKDGSRVLTEINVAMIRDQNEQPLHIQSVVRDVSERKRLEQQLRDNLAEMENIAMQDSLTGLLNRRAIADHVEVEWHRSQREEQPMCVLLIDLDNLKQINDRYGHNIGDQALRQLAEALRRSQRPYDWMGRWGGDEFLMVLPNTNLVGAREVAERCRAIIEAETLQSADGERVQVQASVGLACYSGRKGDESSVDMVLAQADQALYVAKEGGRNRIGVYRD